MADSASLLAGWNCVVERANRVPFVDPEYTTLTYEHADTGPKVCINDVREPNNIGGGGASVERTALITPN